MKRYLLTILFVLLAKSWLLGQQDPQYTNYMYNMSVVNPAYTTNELGLLNFGALYRTQWNQVYGAPKTLTFFGHAALSDKVETGISIISDDIGDGLLKENNFYGDFTYTLSLGLKSKLALGLKAGFTTFNTYFNGLVLPEFQDDTAFGENINGTFPNFGIGAFYHRGDFYAGISVPNFLASKHLEDRNGVRRIGGEKLHSYVLAGYVYEVSHNVKVKPSILGKVAANSPLSLDTSLNVLVNDQIEGGVSYRWGDAISALVNIRVLPSIRIGYAYDYTISDLSDFSSGSHEIFALFDLDLLGLRKGYDKSPRFY
ncbi:MAG: type IX secretion system membrane protein PorP/SprF [Flavobacteriaceae bacterium]